MRPQYDIFLFEEVHLILLIEREESNGSKNVG